MISLTLLPGVPQYSLLALRWCWGGSVWQTRDRRVSDLAGSDLSLLHLVTLEARGRTTVLLCLFGKKICGRNVIATVWADIMGELSQDNLFHLHPPVEYVAVKTLTNQTYRLHLDISRKNYSFSCIHFILIGYQYFG